MSKHHFMCCLEQRDLEEQLKHRVIALNDPDCHVRSCKILLACQVHLVGLE